MKKECPHCHCDVTAQSIAPLLVWKSFSCKQCKTRLSFSLDFRLSILFSFALLFIGILLGDNLSRQNYILSTGIAVLMIIVSFIWYSKCSIIPATDNPKKITSTEIILLILVSAMIYFKFSTKNTRQPAHYNQQDHYYQHDYDYEGPSSTDTMKIYDPILNP